MCLIAGTSAGLTSVNFLSLRIRPCFFVPVKWRLPECIRTILPVAVILKRLAAPRCVFSFFFGLVEFLGITEILSYPRRNSFYAYILLNWGAAALRPYKHIETFTPAARLAADLAWPPERPFWARAARRERCLPCAASFQSGRARRFHPAGASFWRRPLPGEPSRVRDGKSCRAPFDITPGTGCSGYCLHAN